MKKILLTLLAVLALTSAQANEATEDKRIKKLDNAIKCTEKLMALSKKMDEVCYQGNLIHAKKVRLNHQMEQAIAELNKADSLVDNE